MAKKTRPLTMLIYLMEIKLMKKHNIISGFLVILIVLFSLTPSLIAEVHTEKAAAFYNLMTDIPNVKIYRENGKISRLYGQPLGFGMNPVETATNFKNNYSMIYGVDADDLHAESFVGDGRHTLQLMADIVTCDYKFTLVYFTQYYQ